MDLHNAVVNGELLESIQEYDSADLIQADAKVDTHSFVVKQAKEEYHDHDQKEKSELSFGLGNIGISILLFVLGLIGIASLLLWISEKRGRPETTEGSRNSKFENENPMHKPDEEQGTSNPQGLLTRNVFASASAFMRKLQGSLAKKKVRG